MLRAAAFRLARDMCPKILRRNGRGAGRAAKLDSAVLEKVFEVLFASLGCGVPLTVAMCQSIINLHIETLSVSRSWIWALLTGAGQSYRAPLPKSAAATFSEQQHAKMVDILRMRV